MHRILSLLGSYHEGSPPNFLIFAQLVDFRFPLPAHSPLSLTKPTTTTALPPICLTTGSFHFPSHSQPNRPAPLHSRLQQQLLAGDRPTRTLLRCPSFGEHDLRLSRIAKGFF
ncbi:hypothetical protein NC652_023497 [Populus alba x Populus x berolinensis]|nr:hypothetical protein NC652_023497 [Populus alba x Populus x berolinensis]